MLGNTTAGVSANGSQHSLPKNEEIQSKYSIYKYVTERINKGSLDFNPDLNLTTMTFDIKDP